MNRRFIYSLCAASLLLAGCDYNEENFPGYDEEYYPTNVANIVYTLTDADYEAIGGDVATNKYFSTANMPDDYLPEWLGDTYYTADAGSSANLTYRFKTIYPHYQNIPYEILTEDDYTVIYGEGYNNATFLNASNVGRMYRILNAKYTEPQTDDLVMVEYEYSEDGVPSRGETIASWDFENQEEGDIESMDGGWTLSASGDTWQVKEYSNNKYLQFTANYAEAEAEAWLVTPGIAINETGLNLGWDVCVGYWNANCLSVLISTDFAGDVNTATWTDVTAQFNIPQEPTSGYGTMASAGVMSLDDYAGKTIYVAYHYVGNKQTPATTTYQIDNIMVANEIAAPVETETRFALYEYTGNGWYEFENSNHAICLSMADYEEIGGNPGKYYNFDDNAPAQAYMPQFLAKHAGYALDGDTCTVIFRQYDGGNQVGNEQYVYHVASNLWQYCDLIREETRPYGFNGTEWNYNPSVTIILEVGKNIAESSTFYQAIVDWVADNYPEYVTSYGNNDYYYGSSAYQNNFDFRVSAWQGQGTYPGMGSEELTALMWERLPQSFPHALEVLYPNAAPVEGMDVFYTIQFGIYDGAGTTTYTIQYKVVGQGQFEYVEDSLKAIE